MVKYYCDCCKGEIENIKGGMAITLYEGTVKKVYHIHCNCLPDFVKEYTEGGVTKKGRPRKATETQDEPFSIEVSETSVSVTPKEYTIGKRFKGEFCDVQRAILSKYLYGNFDIVLKNANMLYTGACSWYNKYESELLIKAFQCESLREVINGINIDIKEVCTFFACGRSISWIADEKGYDRRIVEYIINKYSGVKPILS